MTHLHTFIATTTTATTAQILTPSLHDALPIYTGNYGLLNFAGGNQTLGGSGTVIFGSSLANALRPSVSGTADRKSTRLNSSHGTSSFAYFSYKKKGHANVTLTNLGTINATGPG